MCRYAYALNEIFGSPDVMVSSGQGGKLTDDGMTYLVAGDVSKSPGVSLDIAWRTLTGYVCPTSFCSKAYLKMSMWMCIH